MPIDEINSENIDTVIETEVLEQLASATLSTEIESTKIPIATVAPTAVFIDPVPTIETERWFEEN